MIVFQTRTVETSISTAMWWSRHVSVCTTTTRQPAVPPAHEWPTDSHNTGHSASPLPRPQTSRGPDTAPRAGPQFLGPTH